MCEQGMASSAKFKTLLNSLQDLLLCCFLSGTENPFAIRTLQGAPDCGSHLFSHSINMLVSPPVTCGILRPLVCVKVNSCACLATEVGALGGLGRCQRDQLKQATLPLSIPSLSCFFFLQILEKKQHKNIFEEPQAKGRDIHSYPTKDSLRQALKNRFGGGPYSRVPAPNLVRRDLG